MICKCGGFSQFGSDCVWVLIARHGDGHGTVGGCIEEFDGKMVTLWYVEGRKGLNAVGWLVRVIVLTKIHQKVRII